MVVENQNRLLREFIARRNEIIHLDSNMSALQRHTWYAAVQVIPDFKYVYCTQAMIRQIVAAMSHSEVSFPHQKDSLSDR